MSIQVKYPGATLWIGWLDPKRSCPIALTLRFRRRARLSTVLDRNLVKLAFLSVRGVGFNLIGKNNQSLAVRERQNNNSHSDQSLVGGAGWRNATTTLIGQAAWRSADCIWVDDEWRDQCGDYASTPGVGSRIKWIFFAYYLIYNLLKCIFFKVSNNHPQCGIFLSTQNLLIPPVWRVVEYHWQ